MWILFAVAAAAFAAFNRTLMKSAGVRAEQKTIVFSRYFYGAFPAILLLAFTGIPEVKPMFYPAILGAVVVDLVAISFMSKSLHLSPMARTVPLLAFTPMFLLLTGHLMLGEFPSLMGLVGVVVIVIGSYWLTEKRAHTSLFEPFKMLFRDKGARYMLGAALCFSVAGPFFKQAVLNSGPFFCMAVSLPLGAILYGLFVMLGRGGLKSVFPQRHNFLFLLGLGIGVVGVALSTNLAFQAGLASYVVSVKRLSILFGIIIGSLIFKEEDIKRYLAAGSIMVGGAVIIALFS